VSTASQAIKDADARAKAKTTKANLAANFQRGTGPTPSAEHQAAIDAVVAAASAFAPPAPEE